MKTATKDIKNKDSQQAKKGNPSGDKRFKQLDMTMKRNQSLVARISADVAGFYIRLFRSGKSTRFSF
ncbi:MAG: hypothetical protein AAGJ08_11125 [Cyanobacteria bacterium P01_H01_bin.35]